MIDVSTGLATGRIKVHACLTDADQLEHLILALLHAARLMREQARAGHRPSKF